jgi:signal peptidase
MLVVAAIFLGFLLATTALSAMNDTWPPFLAVESKSMQHNETASAVGIIDTGDIIVSKRPEGRQEVRTYVSSVADNYRTYGDYGDVVIYQIDGESTPVVHRAIVELVYNEHGGFDVPELMGLPSDRWCVPGNEYRWWDLNQSLELYDIGYAHTTVVIDLAGLLLSMTVPHSGLITMGDNNWYKVDGKNFGIIDQEGLVRGPISWDHVIGKVTGEIPWLGSLRLWVTGTAPDYLPHNTIIMVGVVFGALLSLPLIAWVISTIAEAYHKKKGDGPG